MFSMKSLEILKKYTSCIELSNGIRVLFLRKKIPLVSVRIHVGVGSINDGPHWGSGKAHLLEHVISSSSNNMEYRELERAFDRLGGAANAYTTEESTVYFVTVRSGREFEAIDLLSDMLVFRTFEEEEMEREKKVILEERKLNEEDVEERLYESFKKNLYIQHPLKFPVEGEPDLLMELEVGDLQKTYDLYYVSKNIVIVVSGSFNEVKVYEHLEKLFGKMPKSPPPPAPTFNEPSRSRAKEYIAPNESNVLAHGLIGFKTVSLQREETPYVELLWSSFSEGESSPLNLYLKEKKRLVHHLEAWNFFPSQGPGYVTLYFVTERDKFDDAKKSLFEIIFNYKPDDERLLRTYKLLLREFCEDILTFDGEADLLGGDLLRTGDAFFYFHHLERMKEFLNTNIRDASQFFTPDNLVEIYIVPADEDNNIEKMENEVNFRR